MTHAGLPRTAGFHDGELAVQRRAGVGGLAARLSGMLAPGRLSGGAAQFLAGRTFAALTARDRNGRLWISPLTGPAGFLAVEDPTTLGVRTSPAEGDPLHGLAAGQQVGVIVIEFATRRRFRVNGTLADADTGALTIDVDEAFGNCPQYIQQRHLTPAPPVGPAAGGVRHGTALSPRDVELIRRSDTFLIGTTHAERGADASHRGGSAGFVRVADGGLWWPDYQGNNMFNTLGNLAVDPSAALLFADFTTGRTLQLSGRAAVDWTAPGVPGDDDRTGRRVGFTPEALVAGDFLPLHASDVGPSPHNPELTDLPA
ncbi:pyridoxamine 5'-phosphate oxidase family protein [Streptomyces fructofermentans]|uniref:Pyridoxamine 5'-phosphate oxidase N-terminal domain-containing protein n=1 Tax=Streptomyces fructofermentans TaxID=152141 RepID=A0A918KH95_9ACTN|nr:pyridoxamine 5'-phosphate oxidase family protein [Streptomyces fructofermentans]GGX62843.1 hypothetical protein GCM10010515_33130 [Streptomyces fructofermentans]